MVYVTLILSEASLHVKDVWNAVGLFWKSVMSSEEMSGIWKEVFCAREEKRLRRVVVRPVSGCPTAIMVSVVLMGRSGRLGHDFAA